MYIEVENLIPVRRNRQTRNT